MGSPPTDKLMLNGVAAVVRDLAEFAPVCELFQTHLKGWRKKNALILDQRRKVAAEHAKYLQEAPEAADSDENEHWPVQTIWSLGRTNKKFVRIPTELNDKLEKYNDPSRYHLLRSLDNKQDFSTTESFILLAELHDAAYSKRQLGYAEDYIVDVAEATKVMKDGISQVAVERLATLVGRVLKQIAAQVDPNARNKAGETLQEIIHHSRKELARLVIRVDQHFGTHSDRESVQDAIEASHSKLTAAIEAQGRRTAKQIQIEAERQRQQQTTSVTADEQGDKAEFAFQPDGDGYFIRGFGEQGHFTAKGAKGLHDIFRLVQSPGVLTPMLELDAGAGTQRLSGDSQSPLPAANSQTRQDLAAKRQQLQADIADADSEIERSELQTELNILNEKAKKLFGLNGKPRDLNNPNDRLRPKILGRIRDACDKLATCHPNPFPNLAKHFRLTIGADGAFMKYSPGIPDLEWHTEKRS